MLKLTMDKKAGVAAAAPVSQTVLSVSWLNNRFKAVAVQKGEIQGRWEHPGDIEGTNNFHELIQQAIKETGFRGSTVNLVLAHQRLAHQMVEVPPAKGQALERLINRQAQQQKLFQGEAAWSYHSALPGKGTQRLLLNLFPKVLLNELVTACEKLDLYLTTAIPPTAVLQTQLAALPSDGGDVVMIAAETGGSTTVIVGRKDGQMLLARTLAGTWLQSGSRLALDLNRTILFVNQQFSVNVASVWLFGAGADEHLPELQAQMQLPLKTSPVPGDSFYWAFDALRLPSNSTANFISREAQKAPQKRILQKILVMLSCLLLTGSIAAASFFELTRKRAVQDLAKVKAQDTRLEARYNELVAFQKEISRKQELVRVVAEERTPPVAGWFIGYLSEALPSSLVVTNLHINRESNFWHIKLQGTVQPGSEPLPPKMDTGPYAAFTNRLVTGPFHMRIIQPEDAQPSSTAKPAIGDNTLATWVTKLSEKQNRFESNINTFSIEGVIK